MKIHIYLDLPQSATLIGIRVGTDDYAPAAAGKKTLRMDVVFNTDQVEPNGLLAAILPVGERP